MAKDIYKNIGERYGLDKQDRKDVKVGAVAVLQGECLTSEQKRELRMEERNEWRGLLSWQKKLLTDALMDWLRSRKCDSILQKINAMTPEERKKFLSEAIRTKKKSFPKPPASPSRTENTEETDDIKSEDNGDESRDGDAGSPTPSQQASTSEPVRNSKKMSIDHLVNGAEL